MEKPPSPGVSTLPLGPSGRSSTAGAQPKPASTRAAQPAPAKIVRSQPKPSSPKADPIDITKGRQIVTGAPAGVNSRRQDIVEIPLPRAKNSERTSATIHSVDGNTYHFRYLDTHGREFPWTKSLVVMVALIEQAKGGDVLEVFRAFNTKFEDENGQAYCPVPEATLQLLRSSSSPDSVFDGVGDAPEPSDEGGEEEEAAEQLSFFGGNV